MAPGRAAPPAGGAPGTPDGAGQPSGRRLRVLVVTGGHRFAEGPFYDLWDADEGLRWEHVAHPEALGCFGPGTRGRWDAVVAYDLPGVVFRAGQAPELVEPPAEYRRDVLDALGAGQGVVFVHHALAGWPAWEAWADVLGGRYHYRPGRLWGRDWPDSGYRMDAPHHVRVVAPDHPVCAGLGTGFDLVDELYCAPVDEQAVVPLLRSDADFACGGFTGTMDTLTGRDAATSGWSHPPGSSLVAWAKRAGQSPVVYVQPGDGPPAFANPAYRRLLGNAVRWVASPEAHRWAREAA